MMKSVTYIFMNLMFFISLINLMINSIMFNNKFIHPMILSLFLLMFTIFNTMNLSLFNNTSIIAMMTFLIIIGGLMIMFLYFTSFINDKMMVIKMKFIMKSIIKLMMIIIMIIINLNNFNLIINYFKLMEMKNFMNMNNFNSLNSMFEIIYMYSINKNINTLISMMYLFLCMTFIVKMHLLKKKSIRKIN